LAALRDEHAEQLLLLLELEEDVAGHQGELGPEVPERRDGASDQAHRLEPGELALDPGDEHGLLRAEVVEEAARTRGQAGRPLDLRHRRGVVAAVAEQTHGLVEQALAGRS
jgi:hypothetical protein